MCSDSPAKTENEALWRLRLTEGHRPLRLAQWFFKYLPAPPRCKMCRNPFGGIGGKIVGLVGFAPSRAEAAIAILEAVGDRGPTAHRLSVGGAVNSGVAFVGNVGAEGVVDFTALGDAINTAARLRSNTRRDGGEEADGRKVLPEAAPETVVGFRPSKFNLHRAPS